MTSKLLKLSLHPSVCVIIHHWLLIWIILWKYFSSSNIKRRRDQCGSTCWCCLERVQNFNFRRRSLKQKAVQRRLWKEEAVRHNAVSALIESPLNKWIFLCMKALDISNLMFDKNLCSGSTRAMTEKEPRGLPFAVVWPIVFWQERQQTVAWWLVDGLRKVCKARSNMIQRSEDNTQAGSGLHYNKKAVTHDTPAGYWSLVTLWTQHYGFKKDLNK